MSSLSGMQWAGHAGTPDALLSSLPLSIRFTSSVTITVSGPQTNKTQDKTHCGHRITRGRYKLHEMYRRSVKIHMQSSAINTSTTSGDSKQCIPRSSPSNLECQSSMKKHALSTRRSASTANSERTTAPTIPNRKHGTITSRTPSRHNEKWAQTACRPSQPSEAANRRRTDEAQLKPR